MKEYKYKSRKSSKTEFVTNLATKIRLRNENNSNCNHTHIENNLKCNDIKTLISKTTTIFISEKEMALHQKNITKNINSLRETLGKI